MPGHKRNEEFLRLSKEAVNFDITEIPDMDNLHEANSFIHDSQKRCAKLFGADESFYLVNGSTCGIIAAILSCVSENDLLLVARGSHKSVYSGIIYSGAKPVYVYPRINKYGFQSEIDPKDIHNAIKNNNNIKACLITSPTYEGLVSDIKEIAKICHENGIILIVDEAHGAHFKFSKYFPETALAQGADVVIQSFHKTLPAFTQSAVLHVKGSKININLLKKHLSMLQSSSPSYLLMLGLDNCIKLLEENGDHFFKDYLKTISYIRKELVNCKNIELVSTDDIGKLTFYINREITGQGIEKLLRDNYKIQIELSSKHHFILMTSIADKKEGFLMLLNAILELDKKLNFYPAKNAFLPLFPKPVYKIHPKEAIKHDLEKCSIKTAIGGISCDFFTPFPPGIPILVPGEEITKELADYITSVYGNISISSINT